MHPRARRLLGILDLEQIEDDIWRGQNEARDGRRLFGGQVLAQALGAAARTATRPAHSLHGYFLRPGDASHPVLFTVERMRSGRSFESRRVVAVQHGEAIFSMDASFHANEPGPSHAATMPDVPDPDDLADDVSRATGNGKPGRERPFFIRSVNDARKRQPGLLPGDHGAATASRYDNPIWLRYRLPVPDDDAIHRQLLAYASDMGLVSTALAPHPGARGRIQSASLDHALWFHQSVRVDDWLLYTKSTTTAAGARGFTGGSFFTRDGTLVATALQEGLIRPRKVAVSR